MQTIFYVQGFRAGEGGLAAGPVLWRTKEGEARWAAQLLAERYDGVLAWRQDGDDELGEYEAPVVLVSEGRVPELEA
jgi:hypothetical protein